MRSFKVFHNGKLTTLTINNVKVDLIDCARVEAEYKGHSTNRLLCYGGGHKRPFIRFGLDFENPIDIVLTEEIIEYVWDEIGRPTTGLLYGHTNNYKANWCD